MAAKGSFGSYSSVPTTTGMGQGSAQVFTPQAIQLDTTAIQRGAQDLGQGIAKADADKKAADADKKAAEAARKKKMMDVTAAAYKQETDFPKTEALKQKAVDDYMKSSVDGTPLPEAEKELMKNLGYIDVINKQAKEGFKNAQSQTGEYKDALYWDEEGMKYENPAFQYEFLGDSSTDDVEDIQLWASDTMDKMSPRKNENIMYNPKFTEGDMNKALLDEIDASLRLQGKEKLNRVYNDRTGELIVQETLTGIDDDVYNSALEAVQNRPDFLASYMTTRAIEEGNAPSMLSDQNAKDIYQKDFNSFVQQAGERYRPSKVETKTVKTSPKDDGSPTVKYEVTYEGGSEGELKGNSIQKQPSLILGEHIIMGKNVSGLTYKDGKQVAIVTSKDEGGNIVKSFDANKSVVTGYKNVTRDKASGGEKGSIVSAQEEFDKSKPKEVDVTKEIETLTGLVDKYKRKGVFGASLRPFSGDNEEKVLEELEGMGYDTDGVLDLLEDINFTKQKDVEAFVRTLIDSQPNVAARRVESKPSTQENKPKETPAERAARIARGG